MAEVLGAVSAAVSVYQRFLDVTRRLDNTLVETAELKQELQRTSEIFLSFRDVVDQQISGSATVRLETLIRLIGPLSRFTDELAEYVRRRQRKRWRMKPQAQEELIQILQQSSKIYREFEITFASRSLTLRDNWQREDLLVREATGGTIPNFVLDWLDPYNSAEQQSKILQNLLDRGAGDSSITNAWLFEHPEFLSWKETAGKTMWCTGLPGAGKTYHFTAVVKHLYDRSPTRDPNVAYFYVRHGDPQVMQQNFIASILSQLANRSPRLKTILAERYQLHGQKRIEPDFDDVISILLSELDIFPHTWLLIDSLDEYPQGPELFLHKFNKVINHERVSVFLTSRPTYTNKILLKDVVQLEIPALNSGDIREYIYRRIDKREGLSQIIRNNQSELFEKIVQASHGTFLYSHLLLDSIFEATSIGDIKQILASSPSASGDIHGGIIIGIIHDKPKIALLALEVLTWLTFTERPMTFEELGSAIAIETSQFEFDHERIPFWDSLLTACRGLVTTGAGKQRVALVHYITREYLAQNLSRLAGSLFPQCHSPHALITQKCLTYLCLHPFGENTPKEISDLEDRPDKYPFLSYAASCWGWHARRSKLEEYVDLAMKLFKSSAFTMAAGLMMARQEEYATHYGQAYKGMRALHMCAIFGLDELTQRLLRNSDLVDINEATHGEWTALHWAARHGSEKVVSHLLEAGASSGKKTQVEGWTPMHLAAIQGHQSILCLLIEAGGDVNARDIQNNTPLYLACWAGRLEVVKTLLSSRPKADANLRSVHGGTPLHCAAKQGHVDIVRELMKHCDVTAVDRFGQLTPLDEARRKGHLEIVGLLEKVDTEPRDPNNSPHWSKALSLAGPNAITDIFNWTTYEVDAERTSRLQKGNQSTSHVLRKLVSERPQKHMLVFRKTFNLTVFTEEVKGSIIKYFSNERQILHRLRHPNIVSYLDFEEHPDQNAIFLYMEYCDLGDLKHLYGSANADSPVEHETSDSESSDDDGFFAHVRPHMGETTLVRGIVTWGIIYQLSSALAYLHFGLCVQDDDGVISASFQRSWQDVIHRDIKPANVVMMTSDDERPITKLCDLGIASEPGSSPEANATRLIGSAGFLPPEVERREQWTKKGDIFCLGATIRDICKFKDEEEGSIGRFVANCTQSKKGKRKSSLHIMEDAYYELQKNGRAGFSLLPIIIQKQLEAIHALLGGGGGGYFVQALRKVAELLDTIVHFEHEEAKEHRKQTLARLLKLLDDRDGGQRLSSVVAQPYEYTVHLLVLLGKPKDLKHFLDSSKDIDVNAQWKRSLWTPLHIAAQEGKREMVETLRQFGASKMVKDFHGRRPVEYAKLRGWSNIEELLEVSSRASTDPLEPSVSGLEVQGN